jgi:hypothetical protein
MLRAGEGYLDFDFQTTRRLAPRNYRRKIRRLRRQFFQPQSGIDPDRPLTNQFGHLRAFAIVRASGRKMDSVERSIPPTAFPLAPTGLDQLATRNSISRIAMLVGSSVNSDAAPSCAILSTFTAGDVTTYSGLRSASHAVRSKLVK